MLLLITLRFDASADLLVERLGAGVFRLNVDAFGDYSFCLEPDRWYIRNPVGLEISSITATRCMWWKAMLVSPHDDPMIREEVRYAISEVYNWFRARGLIIGNPPWTDRLAGKMTQLGVASAHFRIPATVVAWGAGSLDQLDSG
ncbi:MAG: hypothetical protein EBX92_09140, partial [Actinobacteria bacterium]|nr:hypothetical protein [Actinomycetota bacterium]